MKTLLRRLLGPSKRELRAKLDTANALAESRRVKAEEGDRLLCREIDNLNNELDGLSHQFAPLKFENDRLVGENATLKAHLEIGQRHDKLLADEKERLRLDAVELRETIERLGDDLNAVNALLCDRNGYIKAANREIEALTKERDRLCRMLAEPEFLRAETERVGDIVTTSADLKHWAARVMVKSFAASLGGDKAVELTFGNEEYGRFVVTVREDDGRSLIDAVNEAEDKVRTLEIALEASAELEQKWKKIKEGLRRGIRNRNQVIDQLRGENQRFSRDADVTSAENRRLRGQINDLSRESEHVKGTCVTLRKRVDRLAHALIGLTKAVSEVRSGRPKPAGYLAMLGHQLDRAVAEADGVLASEQSAA